nr:hypothetical protein [Tanacetum cinerariifolium]
MKGVMAFASQKVEELAKENPNWTIDSWQISETPGNEFNQEFGEEKKGWNSNGTSSPAPSSGVNGNSVSSSGRNFNSVDSGSWDDWDNDGNRKPASATVTAPDWAAWDDVKDDGHGSFYKSDAKSATGKSDGNWSGASLI